MDDEQMPATISDVPTPSFLVDFDKVKKNAQKMTDTCERLGVQLRPHMKTHKTVELGTLITNGTNRTIEVSTLDEAEFYVKNGFDDILYAHPLIAARIERCKNLAYKLESFHVMIENSHGLDVLLKSPLTDGKKWSVFLEVDDGSGRSMFRIRTGRHAKVDDTDRCTKLDRTDRCTKVDRTDRCARLIGLTDVQRLIRLTDVQRCAEVDRTDKCTKVGWTDRCGTVNWTNRYIKADWTDRCTKLDRTDRCATVYGTGRYAKVGWTDKCAKVQ
ncbi:unnamed protein product [Mytilus coruscus]|uniref:Alanine racemase N-terminal domain-containing protein n=1 Tax=Mytilus coruscus TaxID=42192 RepID=A0A6J8CT21_MYTCO|nr:unnamed protein product [Mytilus coruscus]